MTELPQAGLESLKSNILAASDRCVACGLCVEYCPTYRIRRLETESPRGRIALTRGLADGVLQPSPELVMHLDTCTGCRNCERLCPAHVSYAELMGATRSLLAISGNVPSRAGYRLVHLLRQPRLRKFMTASWVKALMVAWPLNGDKFSYWRKLLLSTRRGTKAINVQVRKHFVPSAPFTRTGLFIGCLGDLDTPLILATRKLLEALGHEVVLQKPGTCCGGLSLPGTSSDVDPPDLAAFFPSPCDRFLGTISGCSARLFENAGDASTLQDITAYLANVEWPERMSPRPLSCRVAVHEPCSQRFPLRQASATYQLLDKIPGIEVVPLESKPTCCGGAGTYPLSQPEMAQALAEEKHRQIAALAPDFVVTSNLGCALQLRAAIYRTGLPTEVIHPVELFARQLSR